MGAVIAGSAIYRGFLTSSHYPRLGMVRLLDRPPQRQVDQPPYQLYNLGSHHPMPLLRFIEIIEQEMGKIAQKNWLPMQPGDVPVTYADIDSLAEAIDFRPTTDPQVGIRQFVQWYQHYYGRSAGGLGFSCSESARAGSVLF